MLPALVLALLSQYPMGPGGPIYSSPSRMSSLSAPLMTLASTSGAGMGTECGNADVAGVRGEAITTTRSTTALCSPDAGTTVVTVSANKPRAQYIGTTLGLYVESSATNRLTRSSELDNATWSKAGTTVAAPSVTANNATAPDGTLTAETVVFPATVAASGQRTRIFEAFASVAGQYTLSGWLRNTTGSSTLYVYLYDSASVSTHGLTGCALTTTWSRCVVENITMPADSSFIIFGSDTLSSKTPAIAAQTVEMWGIDLKTGVFASSHYPTTSAIGTRSADVVTTPNLLASADTTWNAELTANSSTTAWATGAAVRGLVHWGSTYGAVNTASLHVDATGHPVFEVFDSAGGNKKVTGTAVLANGSHLFQAFNAAGTLSVAVDANTIATTASTDGGTGIIGTQPASLYVGGQAALAQLNGTLSSFCMDNRSSTRCPIAASIIALGDSITAGALVSPTYPQTLRTTLGATYGVVNAGVVGDTVTQAKTRYDSTYRTALTGSRRTVVVLIGVNDLLAGTSAATIETTLGALYDEVRADGFTLVPVTQTPFKNYSGWSSAIQTQLGLLNTWIAAYAVTNSLTLIDAYASFGDTDPQKLLAAYDRGDGLHHGQVGSNAFAALVRTAFP